MITNFKELIPQGVVFSIKQINDMQLIKSDMLKKLILNRKIEVVKIGNKNFIESVKNSVSATISNIFLQL